MASYKLGVNAKAYRNTGTYGSPTWNELTEVGDFTVNVQWDTQDVPLRGQRVKKKVKTLLALSVSCKHLAIDKPASADTSDYTALWDALMSDGTLDLLVLNGPVDANGVRGFRFDAQVTNGTENQGAGEVLMDEMAFEPVPSANDPKKVLVASGSPTFAPLTGDLTAAFA